jgi:hypothetical protein
VDDDEGSGAIGVGVCVLFGGTTVGGPAGGADAEGAIDGVGGDNGLEVTELAGRATEFEGGGATGYGDAGGVVAAVLETAQAFNDDGDDGLRTNVSNDSTHVLECRWMRVVLRRAAWDFCGRGEEM